MKDKKRFRIFLILGIIIFVCISSIARIIRETVEVYKLNIDKLPNNYIVNTFKDINTYKSFFKISNPVNILGWIIIGWYVLSYIIGKFGLFKVHEKYEQTDEYGSHGTSRWKTETEIKQFYYENDTVGWFLGSINKNDKFRVGMKAAYHSINNNDSLNMQCIVIGPPGSNKTTGFVLPNIFHLCNAYKNKSEKADLIITDPKSELYALTSEYLENNDYEVRVLDFINQLYGDCLNSFDYIEDDKTLMEIAQGYIESVGGANGSSGDQKFWNDQESQVLAALMGFIKQVYPKEKQNFTELSKILVSEDVSDIDSARYFFKNHNVTGAAEQLWNNFLMLAESERTRANILGGLAEKLKLFAIKGIQELTSKTTIDIKKIGRKKEKPIALFILMPDADRTFAPIINVTISSIFKQLYKTAYETNNRLESPVFYILEEMANIGKLQNIQEMLGTMRGRRIYPMMIWQSLSQMKDRYGEKVFEDIMSMCDTHVYLGVNDQFTAKYCSESLGLTTIKTQGISQKADDGIFTINQKSESQNYQQRNLLFPDECKKLDNRKLILIARANNPVQIYKVQYKYWEYKLCNERKIQSLEKMSENFKKEVINITCEIPKERDVNLEHNKIKEKEILNHEKINEEREKNVEEREGNEVVSMKNALENAEIDVNALKCFNKKDNDFDIDI